MGTSQHRERPEDASEGGSEGLPTRAVDIAELLQGLPRREAERILNKATDRTYGPGASIYSFGDSQCGVYVVKKGLAEEYRMTESGNRLPIGRAGAGKLFGLSSIEGRYCCFAEAVEESVFGFLSFSALEDVFQDSPKFAVNLLRLLARRLGDMEERLEQLAFSELRGRVAWALLGLSAIHGRRLSGITHETLAEWVAASRPKVSQVLEELQQAGVLRLSRGEMAILRPSALEEWAKRGAAPRTY